MNTLEFIAAIVQALAWPVAIVCVARILAKGYRDSYEED